MFPISTGVNLSRKFAFSSLLLLAACGGGGGSDPAPAPPDSSVPQLSATITDLSPTVTIGKPNTAWTSGSGTGTTTDGVMCATSETFHAHAVVSIYLNGERLALPEKIGLNPGCDYEIHTHHFDGIVHIEAASAKNFTLGQFFSVWGQALSATSVAGLSGTPHFYAIENGKVTALAGDPRAIPLADHKEIAIVVGTPPAKLDNNRMPANP